MTAPALALEFGLLGSCVVCGHSTVWWYRASDRYHPVHRQPACVGRLTETLAELETVAAGAARLSAGPRRGAWARRGAGTVAGTASPAGVRHGLSRGSPFHRPGMLDGAPWVALAQTNYGLLSVPAHVDEDHARDVCRRWRLLSERGQDISHGGVVACGAVVMDPCGVVVESWGEPPAPDRSRWRPIRRVRDWTRCTGCAEVLWPGCLATIADGLCAFCTAADEVDDPRVWPEEPGDPGMAARPEYLGGPKVKKGSTRSSEGS